MAVTSLISGGLWLMPGPLCAASEMCLDYDGSNAGGKVRACAVLTAQVAYRAVSSPPGVIGVEDVDVDERSGGYVITGRTTHGFPESDDLTWSWSCRVDVAADRRSLTATLVAVDRIGP